MAASIQKLLSFTNIKNPKLILAPLKVSCVPSYRYGALVSSTGEKVTHTGQVNENFAINLVAEEPVKEVESRVVSCDGGGGALGHPRVYINLDKDTKVGTCGYCGLQFKQTHHH
ncbi:NADH dehydrogenase [ubiquinone] iron-sulfur protein 6, mitochondrial isoform X2 [Lepisosteus oculatus]|uniref:NADH dehydrogenase [ubiquinone] iron-sulfur protein 6, mitochondrial isoform X2 n=1 Tax=Lepisosteus oculatus TaxID=7918 RepID=UPI0035F50984